MSKLLKFKAKMKNGSLKANFMGSQSGVDADADYIFNESEPEGQAKSFEFSFDGSGKLQANGSGSNPFNLVVDAPTNPYFQPMNTHDKMTMASMTSAIDSSENEAGEEGGVCGCPKSCGSCD